MIWGIKLKKYLEDGNRCKFYGDKTCPCVSNKELRTKYDKKNGYWAAGSPLPECADCACYVEIDPDAAIPISLSGKTVIEKELYLSQYQRAEEERKAAKAKEKIKENTPVSVELLNASGGTAGERLSKAIIGGVLFGSVGAIAGALGKDEANVKLTFKVSYADGSTRVIVEKANSKEAKKLLGLLKT